jgi:preprotein translocase subunit YajC
VPIAASGSSGGSLLPFAFIILLFAAMYFLFIRPQQRRNRNLQSMQSTLAPGAEVMTGSGIYGTVAEVDDEAGTISLEISPDVVVTFARGAVAKVISTVPTEEAEAEDEEAEDEVEEIEAEADEEPDHETDEIDDHQVIERKD